MHANKTVVSLPDIPHYRHIAIALDFSSNDQKLLAHALGQGKKDTSYILIHVVESVSARYLGKDSDDFETRQDQDRMDQYVEQLRQNGYQANGVLGFQHRNKEISRLVLEQEADLLVIGAHGHSGLKDWIYGETINAVRHDVKIPVLVVQL